MAAAERGVRVRLLLDDNNTAGLDEPLAALDSHPNIEVRLFNPFANRHLRIGDFVTDFARVNRRMHNKSFTADNQATIVGGRNVGDEYFGADSPVAFADLDVLAAGSVVRDVSAGFDALLEQRIGLASVGTDSSIAGRRAGERPMGEPTRRRAGRALHGSRARDAAAAAVARQRAATAMGSCAQSCRTIRPRCCDPPERDELHMLPRLEAAFGKPARELDLISPYFVPTSGRHRGARSRSPHAGSGCAC